MKKNMGTDNSLTESGDWNKYYSGRDYKNLEESAEKPSVIEDYFKNNSGRVFELGCGQSQALARSVMHGWDVGGIDFNSNALLPLRMYVENKGLNAKDLIEGDIFSYDNTNLHGKYDLLCSFGFLEHFKDPQKILLKWGEVLKSGGVVISIIPNLFSINEKLFRWYDPEFWSQHVPYTPTELDGFHIGAGFKPINNAVYTGRYDIHVLTPWGKIREKINNDFIFKSIKYISYYGIGKMLQQFPDQNIKLLNSYIMGVYSKQ